jgi:endonuclease III
MPWSFDDVIDKLSSAYGTPEWRPHGDAVSELILTLLSQNTADYNSGHAFSRLLQRFPDWQSVLDAPVSEVEDAIRPGGAGGPPPPPRDCRRCLRR